MDFKPLFDSLSDFFNLFIPGFIFIKTFRFFGKAKSDSFEGTAVASVTISYILNLTAGLLAKAVKKSDPPLEYISILLAFIIALLLVKLKTSGLQKGVFKWIGKISGSENIWQDIFDPNKGARIRCYSSFNNEDVMIEGDVKYFEACEDGECCIALVNYVVTYNNGNKYNNKYNLDKSGKPNDEPVLYLNTRNVHGLEVTRGLR